MDKSCTQPVLAIFEELSSPEITRYSSHCKNHVTKKETSKTTPTILEHKFSGFPYHHFQHISTQFIYQPWGYPSTASHLAHGRSVWGFTAWNVVTLKRWGSRITRPVSMSWPPAPFWKAPPWTRLDGWMDGGWGWKWEERKDWTGRKEGRKDRPNQRYSEWVDWEDVFFWMSMVVRKFEVFFWWYWLCMKKERRHWICESVSSLHLLNHIDIW